jgi:hypothetical protein
MPLSVLSRTYIAILEDQFLSGFRMLETLADVCPDEVWHGVYSGVPLWYQVYHTAYFVDFWFRKDYEADDFLIMRFDSRIPPEFDWELPEGVSIPRAEMREYLRRIRGKLCRIFANLDDGMLSLVPIASEAAVTLLDIFLSQTRHVMYNVGYCNGILRERGLPESDWYAYNEAE